MEVIDLNVKAYKKQSPFRMVIIFVLGVLVGFTLFYMYSLLNPSPKETPPPIPPTSQLVEPPQEEPPSKPEPPQVDEEQKLLSELETISPIIYILNEDKFSDTTIDMLNQIRPFAIVVKPTQGTTVDRDRYLNFLQNVRSKLQSNIPGLPLLAVDFDLNFLQSFPEFQGLPKLSEFNTSTEAMKITEAGSTYAKKLRDWGITMVIGPMIELYVPGRVPETEKGNYIGDTTEAIQWIGLSFGQGLWQEKVIPVLKSFPSKTLAVKKESEGKIKLALEVDNPGGDVNQTISQLATWLFPFSEAVHQNLPAILVSHVSIPLLDDENPYLPSTVSQKIIHGLIRGKWGYDGIIIAEDISEYPIDGTVTYADVALQMVGVGIDLICTSLVDTHEITKMVNIIEQNVAKEAREGRCKKLAKLISAIQPLPGKEKQESIPSPGTNLIAQQSPIQLPVSENANSPLPEALPPETAETASAPPVQTTPSPSTEVSMTTAETTQKEPAPTSSEIASLALQVETPTDQKSSEASVAQDLTQIVTETKPEQKEKQPETPPETPPEPPQGEARTEKPKEEVQTLQKAPQPPGTKAIHHKIVRGETLYNIAQKYNVKPKDLMAWNGIQDPNLIKYGFTLVVYVSQDMEIKSNPKKLPTLQEKVQTPSPKEIEPAPLSIPETEKSNVDTSTASPPQNAEVEKNKNNQTQHQETPSPPSPSSNETIIYTVKYGDTLDSIAKDMRVSKEEIIQLNNLKKPYLLPAGRKLKIPRVPKVGIN